MKTKIEVVDSDWGGAVASNVDAVVKSTAECFSYAIERIPTENVFVAQTDDPANSPITLFDRRPSGDVEIRLSVRGPHWSQFAYQFAHELCHVMANFREPLKHRWMWLEEAVCEAASLFALRRMSNEWETDPPRAYWKPYAAEMKKYVDVLMKDPCRQLPEGQDFSRWLKNEMSTFHNDASQRKKNAIVAQHLLPLFEGGESGWHAVRYLNTWDVPKSASIADYCQCWREQAPSELHDFIDSFERSLS